MGWCFCGLGSRACSTNRSPTKKEADPECGLKVVKFLNPRNFWASEIKQEQEQEQENFTCNKELTLEDLILSSPAFNDGSVHAVDHLHAIRQSSSRKVHPSFEAEIKHERGLHESKDSFSVEILMKTEGGSGQSNSSAFHRSRTEKLKKKVSFRSPEVADIFILERSHDVYVAE